jgi:hypothetical protein
MSSKVPKPVAPKAGGKGKEAGAKALLERWGETEPELSKEGLKAITDAMRDYLSNKEVQDFGLRYLNRFSFQEDLAQKKLFVSALNATLNCLRDHVSQEHIAALGCIVLDHLTQFEEFEDVFGENDLLVDMAIDAVRTHIESSSIQIFGTRPFKALRPQLLQPNLDYLIIW